MASALAAALGLPRSTAEFRSQQYWSSFFEKRVGRPFEWYGEWRQIQRNVAACVPATAAARILVVGCGNSDLSRCMYEAGYRSITNVDFDGGVIAEMAARHVDCAGMSWRTMDVTDMSAFPDASFDAVVDKGTLDAICSDSGPEACASVGRMVAEIRRVLAPGGSYCVVSLGQTHLLSTLLRAMAVAVAAPGADGAGGKGWSSLAIRPFADGDLSSPTCPLFFSATTTTGAPVAAAVVSSPAAATGATSASIAAVPRGLPVSVHIPGALFSANNDATAAAPSGATPTTGKKKAPSRGAQQSQQQQQGMPASSGRSSNRGRGSGGGNSAPAVDNALLAAGGTGAEEEVRVHWVVPGVHAQPSDAAAATTDVDCTAAEAGEAAAVAAEEGDDAVSGIPNVVSSVNELRWAYDIARIAGRIAPDQYAQLDVWVGRQRQQAAAQGQQAGGDSGSAPPGAPWGGGSSVILTPVGAPCPFPQPAAPGAPSAPPANSGGGSSGVGEPGPSSAPAPTPRFTLTIVDVSAAPAPAAVLLVPIGREHEWAFGCREGQEDLARGAGTGRLIFVTLNRDHDFGAGTWGVARPPVPGAPGSSSAAAAVRAELSPIVLHLVPAALRAAASGSKAAGGRGSGGGIPFLAVAEDGEESLGGVRLPLASGTSTLSGGYFVEDVEGPGGAEEGQGGGEEGGPEVGAPCLVAPCARCGGLEFRQLGDGAAPPPPPHQLAAAGVQDVGVQCGAAPYPGAPAVAPGGNEGEGGTSSSAHAAANRKKKLRKQQRLLQQERAGGPLPLGTGSWYLRRLVFRSNLNAIQTEARVCVYGRGAGAVGLGQGEHFGAPGAPASPLLLPYRTDPSHLAFEYHRAMVACLPLAAGAVAWESRRHVDGAGVTGQQQRGPVVPALRVLVVGLGGGALPGFLATQRLPSLASGGALRPLLPALASLLHPAPAAEARITELQLVPHSSDDAPPCQVTAVELDPEVVRVARRYFGLRATLVSSPAGAGRCSGDGVDGDTVDPLPLTAGVQGSSGEWGCTCPSAPHPPPGTGPAAVAAAAGAAGESALQAAAAPPSHVGVSVVVGDGLRYVAQLAAAAAGNAAPRPIHSPEARGDSSGDSGAPQAPVPTAPLAPAPHVLIIDVDSKDISGGLSFPPSAFLAPAFLRAAHDALAPGGLLLINLACRAPSTLSALLGRLLLDFDGGGGGAAFTLGMGEGGPGGEAALNRVVALVRDAHMLRAVYREVAEGARVAEGHPGGPKRPFLDCVQEYAGSLLALGRS